MITRLRVLHPALKGLMFGLIPLTYYLMDKLNYSQAGLAGVLGFFVLTTLFYWRDIRPAQQRAFTHMLWLVLLLMVLHMGFQATLRDAFGVQQEDVTVVQAIFSTDLAESREFFIQYAQYVAPNVALVAGFFWGYWYLFARGGPASIRSRVQRRDFWLTGVMTCLLVTIHFNPTVRKSDPLFYFPANYLRWQADLREAEQVQANLAKSSRDERLNSMHIANAAGRRTVVVVFGESDTRNNWSLYGYERPTTPELEHVPGLLPLRDVIAADASTIGSITRMITPATAEQGDLWKTQPSVVVMAQRTGYKVIWVTNQGSQGRGIVSILAGQADKAVFTNQGGSRLEGTLDEAILTPYREALNDPAEKKLIVVHILGSHPSYNYRYPKDQGIFENRFDDTVAKKLKQQGRSAWEIGFRNMYDSAIHYQDHILASLVNELVRRPEEPAAWIYVSDHGQDVAHNSNFSGHNRRAKEMWEVPTLLWRSKSFTGVNVADETLRRRPYQADVIDHTILGLMGIEGDYYDAALDLFSTRFDLARNYPRTLTGSGLSYR